MTGRTTLKDDILRLSKIVHIVATPGAIWDLAGKGVADFSEYPTFIMDEVDKLLNSFVHNYEIMKQNFISVVTVFYLIRFQLFTIPNKASTIIFSLSAF
ncbi:hypothetical protein RclHR1_02670007 [Rhizophagus clarus]|uniref:ATP-dependent RNA helicase DHH1 n=1 Tax=Rhizophagus clarus TaxID=94130 RepID=A0A2Z6RVP6_9GLOM|nr:hypothetical protein RclHR1_02670007 [Rhizophagus clarus]GES82571.1 ATP-dependent RNA helicase DHH1 [Rhizophagus clarus]